MISISNSATNIEQIKDKHVAFVSINVEQKIKFYIDIFVLLQKIHKQKRISRAAVIKEIIRIKTKNNCSNYKNLLNAILKNGSKITNEGKAYIIKYASKRIVSARNFKIIKDNLEDFLNEYKIFLEIKFEENLQAKIISYNGLCSKYALIGFLIENIFDYEGWFLQLLPTDNWGPYQLTTELDINSCPYCNRQYTYTVVRSSGKKLARPELDHFLPKSQHPFLSLSFFNLIPSCSTCNSSIKGSTKVSYTTHLNPYEDNINHKLIRFSYYPLTYGASIGMSKNLEIVAKYNGDKSDINLKNKVNGNLDLFCLDRLYGNHTDNVQEIIRKRHISSDRYIAILQNTYKSFNLSLEEAYRLAYGNFYEEAFFSKRTLSKLTKDIAIELGALIIK